MQSQSILILAAVIPALLLLIQVYRADRLEKEPLSMLLGLVFWGVVATELAALAEQVGILLLERLIPQQQSSGWSFSWGAVTSAKTQHSTLYDVFLYFGVVAVSEEGIKYLLLKFRTWRSPEFNCTFDGVVYAVFLSLGFALWENIHYVLAYGMSTALARAVTAVPGHACFGVFMGTWYGLAKRAALRRKQGRSLLFRILAFLIPTLLHGLYDFVAASRLLEMGWIFLPFVGGMFLVCYILVKLMSRFDKYMKAP